ncbi:hypothetical protein [Microbacterium azadirachtae]|uniref:hypothetical protein n=1 Tax=Microbacterium azadirachtae TaxID=582680 RepID=UPI003F7558BE
MNPRRSAFLLRAFLGRRAAPALRFGIATAVVAVSVGLAGCTPATAPKPTPTPLFASKAEAFKAAERVYRDYVDAENALQSGDNSANPEQYLTGQALSRDVQSKRESKASGKRVDGAAEVVKFAGTAGDAKRGTVSAAACLDISKTRIINARGEDVTPTSRPTPFSLAVEFVPERGELKITGMTPGSEACA